MKQYSTHYTTPKKKENFTIKGSTKSSWVTYFSKENYDSISAEALELELKNFLKYYKKNYREKYFAIIFKIKFPNGHIRSASTVQLSHTGRDELKKLFPYLASIFKHDNLPQKVSEDNNEENNLFNNITGFPIGNILFAFKPVKNINKCKYNNIILNNQDDEKINPTKAYKSKGEDYFANCFKYNGYEIPLSMDLSL